MNEHNDVDMLAAEFVLGTLDAGERAALTFQRDRDPELDERIRYWERVLAPMNDEVAPVQPGKDVLRRIEGHIDDLQARSGGRTDGQYPPENDSQVVSLQRRLRRWQRSAAVAGVAALLLVGVLVMSPKPERQSFVAVFQQNDQQPAFMLSVDLDTRELTLRPVTARPLDGRSYQLWIKADPLGGKPQSVAVLDDDLSVSADALQGYDPQLLREATFGISVEPEGGSPTGQPTGPAIHGYLYPTDERSTDQPL